MRRRSNSAKCGEGVVEDRRIGLGHADDVAVDDARASRHAGPGPTWQTSRAARRRSGRWRSTRRPSARPAAASRSSAGAGLGDRPAPQHAVRVRAEHVRRLGRRPVATPTESRRTPRRRSCHIGLIGAHGALWPSSPRNGRDDGVQPTGRRHRARGAGRAPTDRAGPARRPRRTEARRIRDIGSVSRAGRAGTDDVRPDLWASSSSRVPSRCAAP